MLKTTQNMPKNIEHLIRCININKLEKIPAGSQNFQEKF